MKTRVLFVDDDPMILSVWEIVFLPMMEEWEMAFVDSGEKALACMAVEPFDVIISDMSMPGMSGAELLNEMMKSYPKTIRFILSAESDREVILRCVGSMHQFLVKPCKPETLKTAIVRALELKRSLENGPLQELVTKINRLPSIPSLYIELVELMRDSHAGIWEVGTIISKDMAMTAKILQLVNSAFFGIHYEVSSPAEAASFLGLETIRSMVLSANAFSQFESVKINRFSVEALWIHSFETAAAAKMIMGLEEAETLMCDQAFVAGMLHDVGKLVLAANFPSQYQEVVNLKHAENLRFFEAEERIFGANHANVGACILGLWGLPMAIVEAVASHHDPYIENQESLTPLVAVYAANAILAAEKNPARLSGGALMIPGLEELGLTDRLEVWRQAMMEKKRSSEKLAGRR